MLYGIPIGYSNPLTMIDQSSKIKRGSQGDATVLRPTIFASVPLILDRIHKKIQERVDGSHPVKKAIFKLATEYKQNWVDRGYGTPIIDSYAY